MKKLIISELQRIWLNKKTSVLLALTIISTIINCVFRLMSPAGSYNAVDYSVKLNSLNFSPFVCQEVDLMLLYIVLPVIFIDSISYEQTIGAFRMYMTRPYKKYEFIISKWISLALTTLILLFTTFVVSTVFGYLFMPKVSTVKFYNIQQSFNSLGALLYIIRFYMVQFLVALFILSIASVISVIIPNPIISIFSVIGSIVILVYFMKAFDFLWRTAKYCFYTLGHMAPLSNHITIVLGIIAGLAISMGVWMKKDYPY